MATVQPHGRRTFSSLQEVLWDRPQIEDASEKGRDGAVGEGGAEGNAYQEQGARGTEKQEMGFPEVTPGKTLNWV